MKEKGYITLANPVTGTTKTLQVKDFVRAAFKDHRLCSVVRTNENDFVLVVENPASSGRAQQTAMYLSEESLAAIMTCVFLFYEHNGIDITTKFAEVTEGKDIVYDFSIKGEDFAGIINNK